jgi:hypothetical protein
MTDERPPGTDEEDGRRDGPRGTMADVSHTPPDWSRAAADGDSPTSDLFARGNERVGRDSTNTAGKATADGPEVDPRRNGHHE